MSETWEDQRKRLAEWSTHLDGHCRECHQGAADVRAALSRLDSQAELVEILTIPHSSAPEDMEDEVCSRCGGPYNLRPGCEVSGECDPCAQEVLSLARESIARATSSVGEKPARATAGQGEGKL
jgi:hypothetical protein